MSRLACLALLSACLAGPARAQELRKLGLDDASALGLRIETDGDVKVEGKASVKIATRWPTTVCLGEVTGLQVESAALVYGARVRSELDGSAFLEMWVHVGGGQYFSRGLDDPIRGKSDWKALRTPFFLQKGQKAEKVTLNLVVNGKGTVWIDDVVLSRGPLK